MTARATTPSVIQALKIGIDRLEWMERRTQHLRQKAMDTKRVFTKDDSDEMDSLYAKCARLCDESGKLSLSQMATEATETLLGYEAMVTDTHAEVFRPDIRIQRCPAVDWFGDGKEI